MGNNGRYLMLNLTKFGTIPSQASGLWLEGWDYGKKITIPADSIDADLAYIPLPVYLNSTNFDFTKCKADGSDIRFTDENLNMLKFERKEHDNTAEMAVYNVQVPTVSNLTDTEIYMWYGNENAYNASIESWRDQTGKALTYNGNVKLITGVESGKRVASFDGTGDYLTALYSTDFIFGSGDFCIEFIASFSSVAATKYIAVMGNNATESGTNFDFDLLSTGKLSFNLYAGSSVKTVAGNSVIADGVRRHYCVTRSGNVFTIYVAGTSDGTATLAFTMNSNAFPLAIGALSNALGAVPMYLHGFRITKGSARYTANFTPPTTFTIDSADVVFCTNFDTIYDENYAMVQHMGDSLVDASGNGNNGTATGTTVVDTIFGNARSFNGTDDKIVVADNSSLDFSSAPFTLLVLEKITNLGDNEAILCKSAQYNSNYANYLLGQNSVSGLLFTTSDSSGTGGHNSSAVTEDGHNNTEYVAYAGSYLANKTQKVFTQGILRDTITATYNATANNGALYIGSYVTGAFFDGIIAGVRISNSCRSDAWIKAESLALKDDLLTFTDL